MIQTAAAVPMARRGAPGNIYTVLALIALLVLGAGIGYMAYKNVRMTGASNPFLVMPSAD
jgi:hypothetical protein